jgi:excisionase family DNA binding protein
MLTEEREKALYSIPEACEYLGNISRASLYRLVDESKIRRVKIGRISRITRSSLDEFVRQLEAESAGDDA